MAQEGQADAPDEALREAAAQPSGEERAEEAGALEEGQPDPGAVAQARIAELEERLSELEATILRLRADYENLRRRAARELAGAREAAAGDVVVQFLPLLDNLGRALEATPERPEAIQEGLRLTLRQAEEVLRRLGVERLAAQGAPFDPNLHEAVGAVATDAAPPGTVAEELTAGYRLGERVLRPAMVRVAAAPPEVSESESGSEPDVAPAEGEG